MSDTPAAAPEKSEATDQPQLTKPYEPHEVEPRWYAFWQEQGVFDASDDPADTRPPYVVPMPPPNVTGVLHMGHAQRVTLQDGLVRYHRMRGFNALWQPGIDHAGIATQLVVERQLTREGGSRQELGREAFLERVWKWKNESGGRIAEQQRLLGASPDWRRSKFTMDADMSAAVKEAFVRLYEQGLMYRATRLINWCPECRTALSDLEVESEEGASGELFEFAYKVDGEDGEIVVATTRPETMLGDTAVAVHPDDPRYTHLHGKLLVHPFVDRKVPIITDAILVDPKFGTGAVKVTPAHDFNDFATGKRHDLPEISVMNLDGTMNEAAGPFAGLDRKRARTAVKKALDEKGLARGSKPHTLTLPHCQRSGGVVEPMISTQWFLKMGAMAGQALEAVRSGKTEIIPPEWTKTYDHFLENIQDWCVSRQLWWGHQIPAWHGPDGEIRVGRERPAECTEANGWTQDPDVLDTWFSSALWPFATLGWPEKTPALAKFYPASDLETGYDILFFWVARMMMFGLHFTGEVPFKRILLSGLLVDESGAKMSKVKGNGIDPLDLIYGAKFTEVVKKTSPGAPEAEAMAAFKKAYPSVKDMGDGFPAFGADALRFTLASFPPSNQRISLAPKRIEGYRHFVNKIWNASRFALQNLGIDADAGATTFEAVFTLRPAFLYNRWILSRLAHAIARSHEGFGSFRIDESALASYRFFYNDFCDWYVELTKAIFAPGSPFAQHAEETRATMVHVLETSLRLMHPLMPFVTEELWQRVPKLQGHERKASIAFGPYPGSHDAELDAEADREMDTIKAVISAARTVRSEHDVKRVATVPLSLRTASSEMRAHLSRSEFAIRHLVNTAGPVQIGGSELERAPGTMVAVVPSHGGAIEVMVGLKGLVTADKEKGRYEREVKRIEKEIGVIDKKLGAKGFVDRAPKEVVEEAQQQRAALVEARARLEESRELAAELSDS
jgi:valyl-tRNA synthetase